MLQIISNQQKIQKKNGGFGIEILFPGKGIGSDDSGIGTIGRIDQATVTPGTLVSMRGYPTLSTIKENALDKTVAKKLWNLAEQVTGVHYPM